MPKKTAHLVQKIHAKIVYDITPRVTAIIIIAIIASEHITVPMIHKTLAGTCSL